MNGHEYKNWIGKYINSNYADRGVRVYTEVSLGKSIIGKNRRIDLLVVDERNNKAVSLECKYQNIAGTTDEKILYSITDAKAMQMDCYIVYGGDGFSKGVVHMLESSELCCMAQPEEDVTNLTAGTSRTIELDHILAMRFNWWDIVTRGRNPLV